VVAPTRGRERREREKGKKKRGEAGLSVTEGLFSAKGKASAGNREKRDTKGRGFQKKRRDARGNADLFRGKGAVAKGGP